MAEGGVGILDCDCQLEGHRCSSCAGSRCYVPRPRAAEIRRFAAACQHSSREVAFRGCVLRSKSWLLRVIVGLLNDIVAFHQFIEGAVMCPTIVG